VRLQKFPGRVVGLRPVLAEDAAANLAVLRQLEQTLLHGDANLAAGAARAVAVNQFQQLCVLLMCEGKFAVEALKGFANQRHVGLEVDGLDEGGPDQEKIRYLALKYLESMSCGGLAGCRSS
jgi:hypothetical protein